MTSLSSALEVQRVEASGTICVRADGSIDPPTAPIQRNGTVYALTGNITSDTHGIIVEKDNIVLDGTGYTVTGSGSGNGIMLTGRSNVTVRNTMIENFASGIYLKVSSSNTLSGNNVTANAYAGIGLFSSSDNNTLLSNNVGNNGIGIMLAYSSNNNVLSGNNVTASNQYGIYLDSSSDNVLSGNNVTANKEDGIWLRNSFGNRISNNNFSNNTYQTYVEGSINTWDNGFPSGGNYWSDYDGTDADHDGIGDTPYIIDANNTDHYPRMNIIPEFPSFLILPIFFVTTLLAVIVYRRKHPQNE